MGAATQRDTPAGLAYALVAYVWWGAMPLYIWTLMTHYGVPPSEVLGHRIVTGLVFLIIVVLCMRRVPELRRALAKPKLRLALLASTLLVGVNWFVYTWAVGANRTMEASLGYFLQPLLNAVMGAAIFRERFRFGQVVSLVIAAAGVFELMTLAGEFPWIAVTLAFSFGLYSTIRKATPVDGLVGLTIETLFLFPAAVGFLWWLWANENIVFVHGTRAADAWIMISGTITSIPMIFFGQAARRLRLSTLGFIQFLSPTLQFIVAVAVFGESFPPRKVVGFVIIWIAVTIFIVDSLLAVRRGRTPADVEAPTE